MLDLGSSTYIKACGVVVDVVVWIVIGWVTVGVSRGIILRGKRTLVPKGQAKRVGIYIWLLHATSTHHHWIDMFGWVKSLLA